MSTRVAFSGRDRSHEYRAPHRLQRIHISPAFPFPHQDLEGLLGRLSGVSDSDRGEALAILKWEHVTAQQLVQGVVTDEVSGEAVKRAEGVRR
jgi:hypothetical protein